MNHAIIDRLIKKIGNLDILQEKFIRSSILVLAPSEFILFENYISFCLAEGNSYDYLADAYLLITTDTFNEMFHFKKHKKYRFSTYKEVSESVYNNPEYMKKYMLGLGITTFLWPNHRNIFRWFQTQIPRSTSGRYLEVGPGHGFFFQYVLENSAYTHFMGIDISPTSLALTQSRLSKIGLPNGKTSELVLANFLDFEVPNPVSAIVAGEVLEHVERPDLFIKRFYELSSTSTFVLFTTVVNAPAIDHIYLFESIEAISKMAMDAGFRIKNIKVEPYGTKSEGQSIKEKLPILVGLVVEKPYE